MLPVQGPKPRCLHQRLDPNVVNISDELMKATVGYIPGAECQKRNGYVEGSFVSYENQIYDSMLCALGAGKEDGCQGDSGGPLISLGNPNGGNKDVLVGLSSWGVACAHDTLPGVYSRVSYSYKWMKMIVCKNSDLPESSGFICGRNTDAQTKSTTASILRRRMMEEIRTV